MLIIIGLLDAILIALISFTLGFIIAYEIYQLQLERELNEQLFQYKHEKLMNQLEEIKDLK